ncbi:unnamed protein product [Leptidea sinapis]|uniref:Peptidase S1 domain-containing protein n=1 Tax=Leptidea sinapis TaxID=189913 RepID=A0A5E4PNP9_9NEOP|nr:unnamed protein product [Leptidea sinapis]
MFYVILMKKYVLAQQGIPNNTSLRQVNMVVIANNVCANSYGSNIVIASTICTDTARGTASTCGGDSGGPLSAGNQLIGITSFGSARGCQSGFPAAFARGGLVIQLTTGWQSVCGASLLSQTRAVTAAHCWATRTSQASQLTTVWGSQTLFSGGVRIVTTNVRMHASYNMNNLNNDIAMIIINSVGLTTQQGIPNNTVKRHVNMVIMDNSVCARFYFPGIVIHSTLCTDTARGTASICGGDSGGPLVIGSSANRILCVLAVLCLVGMASAFETTTTAYNYHEQIGIKEASRIKQAETALDFDGSRIVGGWQSAVGSQPHLAGLVITLTTGRQSVCSASLVSNNRLVTAAHCWWDGQSQARQYVVVLGVTTLFTGGLRIATNNVRMHPNWNIFNANADVAVITVPWVAYTNVIQPIALASGNQEYVGTWAIAAGYGRTSDNTHSQI